MILWSSYGSSSCSSICTWWAYMYSCLTARLCIFCVLSLRRRSIWSRMPPHWNSRLYARKRYGWWHGFESNSHYSMTYDTFNVFGRITRNHTSVTSALLARNRYLEVPCNFLAPGCLPSPNWCAITLYMWSYHRTHSETWWKTKHQAILILFSVPLFIPWRLRLSCGFAWLDM